MNIENEIIELIDKRIICLNDLLGKELKSLKENRNNNNYLVMHDLKSKIYELAFLREKIQALPNFAKVSRND